MLDATYLRQIYASCSFVWSLFTFNEEKWGLKYSLFFIFWTMLREALGRVGTSQMSSWYVLFFLQVFRNTWNHPCRHRPLTTKQTKEYLHDLGKRQRFYTRCVIVLGSYFCRHDKLVLCFTVKVNLNKTELTQLAGIAYFISCSVSAALRLMLSVYFKLYSIRRTLPSCLD